MFENMFENMFRAKVFYKAVFCIVGVAHFFDVILIHDSSFYYWTATTLLLSIFGTSSNAITIKYLVHQRTYKNRHFLLVASSTTCLDFPAILGFTSDCLIPERFLA